jgi:predicted acylesterase/phospholipase RssA
VVTWRRAQMILLSAQGMDSARIAEVTYRQPESGSRRHLHIVGPLVSPRELGRVLLYIGGILGIPRARVPALLDTTRLSGLVRRLIDFDQLHSNIDRGLVSLAVVATSHATGQSVVFHDGSPGLAVQTDVRRAISYVPSRIDGAHVHASASIPVAFAATRVDEPSKPRSATVLGGVVRC